ncbi:hypothetical protein CFP56_022343 [Quercus suber]|uniref:Uncharacterized protein n=1 Tax=Quercus suber TaxID=58331 RepID=A0AAW0KBH7_QUESU
MSKFSFSGWGETVKVITSSSLWNMLSRHLCTQLSFSIISVRERERERERGGSPKLHYSYDDNHSLPSLEAHMKSMFYESVSV